jgi:uncharacterized membrane protein YvbJ
MKCENCGTPVHQGDQVCSKCGHKLVMLSSVSQDANELPDIELNYTGSSKKSKTPNKKLCALIILFSAIAILALLVLVLYRPIKG